MHDSIIEMQNRYDQMFNGKENRRKEISTHKE